ncbi:hypothetical protein ZOSMA_415G00160 [Zostera marina]|uniref:Uncharacterized protein n=1 Tax=Zostera marina TaxID=29655 RepID=A0A0K9P523_ZOSMR|nr:hypothetical protein ZOSMA_415G00160 [Zostera marina]
MESKHLVLFFFFFATILLEISAQSSSSSDIKGTEADGVDGGRKLYHIRYPRGLKPYCDKRCWVRCTGNSNHKACLRTCGTCCSRCRCVPPGRYASRNSCGACYARMTTHHGWLKCP